MAISPNQPSSRLPLNVAQPLVRLARERPGLVEAAEHREQDSRAEQHPEDAGSRAGPCRACAEPRPLTVGPVTSASDRRPAPHRAARRAGRSAASARPRAPDPRCGRARVATAPSASQTMRDSGVVFGVLEQRQRLAGKRLQLVDVGVGNDMQIGAAATTRASAIVGLRRRAARCVLGGCLGQLRPPRCGSAMATTGEIELELHVEPDRSAQLERPREQGRGSRLVASAQARGARPRPDARRRAGQGPASGWPSSAR